MPALFENFSGYFSLYLFICGTGVESKLRDVCDELLGPLHKSKTAAKWEPMVLVSVACYQPYRFVFRSK